MSTMAVTQARTGVMTSDERFVILASSLGTVFEWYDFYLYGSLASIIGAQFFSAYPPATRDIFALLAFAAGFLVRPFGAIVFGRIGDIVGRKYTFLVTILIMGLSTFIVGLLPNAATIGFAAPVILIALRLAQGLALGGEYGGAATYVAEHSPHGKRGYYTSFIQTTATLGLFLSLLVILFTRSALGEPEFAAWGWRIPFLVSVLLFGFSVWYTSQFYALFFMQSILKVDGYTANLLIAWSLLFGTGFFIVFGVLSDKIGRKPIILGGCLIAALTYLPIYMTMHTFANPQPAVDAAGKAIQVATNPNILGLTAMVWIQIVFVTMVYGPIAAFLVEFFPARIRYTSLSVPYHLGNGEFGGWLPYIATAIVAASVPTGALAFLNPAHAPGG